ncbi:50S ribosomal protein L29 [Xiashengella succiniciproducens]|jgi:large subunit ribosomal protein L29|uniref:Large ribosomal subunit protein uL29 n=1 Tax=Xiashengella succiniciproducens TaxID=2949635 RepID=A0A9J6ZRR0_9BACT|nr:50S ribosomal protein L29 [Alkaliflexus sp. Ai-910]MDI9537889.1 50S ribosomal protein L29 [Bacteroidota bacterium]URW80267.1 50S ribosomal protein L29 [Alkaliflexus sp. Ai-910]HHU00424.1 50S ribosomal protein L29 [Bacteroidales bacterium]
MKTTEIREMSISDIQERIEAEKAELVRLKLNHHISPLDNPIKIRQTRRNIARMLTVLSQKQKNENR